MKAFLREDKEAKSAHKLIPAELYGPETENKHLLIDSTDLEKIFVDGGKAVIIDLDINSDIFPVVIKDIQRDPIKSRAIHADLYQIKADQKITVEVALNPTGKSLAITNMGATLVKNIDTLKIECLPKDLVKHIDVDLAKLENLKAVIRVEDLVMPNGVIAKTDGRAAIFSVMASRKSKSAKAAEPAKPAVAAKK